MKYSPLQTQLSWFDFSMFPKVRCQDTMWKVTYDFVYVFHSNIGHSMYRFSPDMTLKMTFRINQMDSIKCISSQFIITSPPEGVARYCFHPVCLSVCVCVCLSVCVRPIFWYFISRLLEGILIWNSHRIRTVQITFIFIGQTHLVFANAFAPVLRNTQTRFELFWIGLRIRNAFGTFETQIFICDLWAVGGFSFGFGFSFRNSWSVRLEECSVLCCTYEIGKNCVMDLSAWGTCPHVRPPECGLETFAQTSSNRQKYLVSEMPSGADARLCGKWAFPRRDWVRGRLGLYRAGDCCWVASVCSASDWVTSLWISLQTCTGLAAADPAFSWIILADFWFSCRLVWWSTMSSGIDLPAVNQAGARHIFGTRIGFEIW